MKKTSTSKLKKLPLLLGTLLIISVAAYGTRAYFSDSSTVQGDIQLSLGNVDITTTNDALWSYTPIAANDTIIETNDDLDNSASGETGQIYTNVRPGDSFTRKYTITNNGSLDAKVNLKLPGVKDFDLSSLENDNNVEHGPFTITVKNLEENFTLDGTNEKNGKNVSKDFYVTIKVDLDADESKSYNNPDKITVDYLEQVISVTAVQTNAQDSTN